MKKRSVIYVVLALLVAGAACKGKAKSQSALPGTVDDEAVVAKVGDQVITAEELNEAAKPQLQRIEMKVYQIRKRVLDSLIEEKLLANAAKREGLSKEEYVKKRIDDNVSEPREEEIKAMYDARKGKDTRSFDKVKEQVSDYLKQSQAAHLRRGLITRLRKATDVKVMLDAPRIEVDIDDAPTMGPKGAKVTLVEFSDYQCPFSRRARDTVWQLVEKYGDKLRYVYKDFPLSFHRDSQKAHEAAHCAGDQGKYFEYNKMLFNNQNKLKVEDLKKYAKELGLNRKKFDKCLDSGEHEKIVKESIEAGTSAGVSGTPAFFVNGILVSGAQPITAFSEIIDNELGKQ